MLNEDTKAEGAKIEYKSYQKWITLAFVCLLFYLLNGFIYTSFNVMVRTIAIDLNWSAAERAFVTTGLFSGMIWFIFVAGIMLDKISPKRMVIGFSLLGAAVVFLRSQVTEALPFFILMFLYGVASGFVIPALNKINSLWFDQKGIFLANGFLTASSPLGQVTGNMLSAPLVSMLGGWRQLFVLQSILFFVVIILFAIFIRDRKNLDAALRSDKITSEKDLGIIKNIKEIIKVPRFWLYTLADMCLLGMIYAGGAQGQIVLQGDPNWKLPATVSGIIPSCNNLASMTCYILMPIIINRFFKKNYEKNFKLITIITGVIATVCFYFAYRSYDVTTASILMIISGIAFGTCVPAPKVLILKLPEVSGPRAGTAVGVYLTLERVASTIMTGFIGGFIAMYPNNSAEILSNFWLIMIGSPIFFTISLILDWRQKKKAGVASA